MGTLVKIATIIILSLFTLQTQAQESYKLTVKVEDA